VQLQGYLLYFDWQWGKALAARAGAFSLRTVLTIVFIVLGIRGSVAQRRSDRDAWWLFLALFLITGLGLVFYMNFKPGFSLGYAPWPNANDHEVRERDYFFVVSFITWGIWAGIGLADIARGWLERRSGAGRPIAALILAGALLPVIFNWNAASRRHGPDARLAADVAYNLLNTVPPNGILFTYGDNDTFPLWWAQEVEGIRRDVTIVCLALANTDWYMRQLRENPNRAFDPAAAPAIWKGRGGTTPNWPVHSMTDEQIDGLFSQPYIYLDKPTPVPVGPVTVTYPAETVLDPNDVLTMRIVQQNAGRRPIVWSITTGGEVGPLRQYVVQQGLGYRFDLGAGDSSATIFRQSSSPPLDVPLTDTLAWHTYRFAGLDSRGGRELESTSESFALTLAVPFTQLAFAYEQLGRTDLVVRNLERALALSPNPAIQAALDQMRLGPLGGARTMPGSDTARAADTTRPVESVPARP
jgi:hypothetical protein